ncbi:putative molluscan insulin-related peptide(s) receptor [Pomacea canaliculata]|uniref:putative molluscan insulin-related peptide(s) receptor n=1 Tax=Pomacea canaliculata TaxID=400727 RepID=UPI000D73E1E0|nr:putative molluscan insulin-related peptide(s) receptor [Pomacea canaliculata]
MYRNLEITIWCCSVFCVALVVGSCSQGNWKNGAETSIQNPTDGACRSIDVRNSVDGLKKLENCTVIEGKLHILLIDHAEQKDYDKFRFPLLREITGHLLLYRVYGLKTLRHLFPNLTVIRGQDLFYNYALVAYEMPDLEEIGLISLTTIMRGAVRLTKNRRLCYVDTIDWSRIAVGLKTSDHHIQDNKDETKCVNYCPDYCSSTTFQGKELRRCWTATHCQKNLECKCGSNMSACVDGGTECCHEYCVGGCHGKDREKCDVCRNVYYQKSCHPSCPPFTYMFMERRCLTENECLNLTRKGDKAPKWKLMAGNSTAQEPNRCLDECPTGYTANEQGTHCIRCNRSCPKECVGRVVDSIEAAQTLKGCNKIQGPLEIQIMGGSSIGIELEESLGAIEEVTQYIKIVRSYALLSLHFFKSLRIINGEVLEHQHYSLIVMDNTNLQELFTEEVTKNLKVLNGLVSFHSNRKLCLQKIHSLVQDHLHINASSNDISTTTNGDLMPCYITKLNLRVQKIMRNVVILEWDKTPSADPRQVLTYIINYRLVDSDTVNIYQGRDACSNDVWKTVETPADPWGNSSVAGLVPNLKPWTKYAAYVQAYMLNTASHQALSDVIIFTTSPDFPTSPVDLHAAAEQMGELHVTWKKPKQPNGNVTHYVVYWQLQEINSKPFDQRNYCTDPIDASNTNGKHPGQEESKNTTQQSPTCCQCPKSSEELIEEERERQIEIEFENYLHDNVYCKRADSLPLEIDQKYNLTMLTRRKRQAHLGSSPYSSEMNQQGTDNSSPLPSPAVNVSNGTEEGAYLSAVIYDMEIVLTNLGHFQEYNIEVLACHEAESTGPKRCSSRAITVARTKPLENADNINASSVEVHQSVNSSGEVMIKWAPPPRPNGLIIKYYLQYRSANREDVMFRKVCVSQRKYHEHSGYRLTNMESGNYTFQLAAVSLAGNGSYTPLMYFYVPPPPAVEEAKNNIIIITVIVGVIIVIIVTAGVILFVIKSRSTKTDLTVISPNPGYMPSGDMYIPDEWEIDRDSVQLVKELGQGSFGMVYEGTAKNIPGFEGEIKVAVKTVNVNAGFQERWSFLREATTMKAFKCYHVVRLLGVVSKGQPCLVVMELMANGDLKNYLRRHRPDEEDNKGARPPTIKEMLQMAGEIADGMAYLADKKFVHRDLAARNCMVSENRVVKVGDFGMTRDIYETDYYRKGGRGLLPVRWMAPESLKDGVFTTMSDVWSYGVVLWEMVTLAAQPYQGMTNEETLRYVSDGHILEKPAGCPEELFNLMSRCWEFKPKKRPTFKMIIEDLVPNLNPSFQHVSYFFSEESRTNSDSELRHAQLNRQGVEREEEEEEEDGLDCEEEEDEIDLEYAGLSALEEESRIPFMTAEDPSHYHHHFPLPHPQACASQRSPSHGKRGASSSSSLRGAGASGGPSSMVAGAGAGSGSGSPCECVLLEELPNGHRLSACSSPVSNANANSDGSKGSSKSSGSYSHMNGLANGHIFNPYTRTAPC